MNPLIDSMNRITNYGEEWSGSPSKWRASTIFENLRRHTVAKADMNQVPLRINVL